MATITKQKRERRHRRIRAKVGGNSSRPRLSVYRSNKYIYAQIINDEIGKTIASVSDRLVSDKEKKQTKLERAKAAGTALALAAKKEKVGKVVFDRGGFLYAGRVKALSEGAREGGLEF